MECGTSFFPFPQSAVPVPCLEQYELHAFVADTRSARQIFSRCLDNGVQLDGSLTRACNIDGKRAINECCPFEVVLTGILVALQVQLKGHRSVGGMRASVYNSMPLEGAKTLAAFMQVCCVAS